MFEYTARNQTTGQIMKGTQEAPNKEEVTKFLRKNKMAVVSIREQPKEIKIKFGGGIKTRDIVIFTRQFATMINAGLPLVQSLDILAQQTENKKLAEVVRAVVYDVESGNTLADAFRKHPKAFTDLYVNMVAAGEAGGILDTILPLQDASTGEYGIGVTGRAGVNDAEDGASGVPGSDRSTGRQAAESCGCVSSVGSLKESVIGGGLAYRSDARSVG